MPTRLELPLQVTDETTIAVTVVLPDQPVPDGPQPVLFLFPGGGMSRRYFDLHFQQGTGYSQAEWHAQRGVVVVAVDSLGVGESSLPGDALDPTRTSSVRVIPVRREEICEANHLAVQEILGRLRTGTLAPQVGPVDPVPFGSGHSVGGHVVVSMQALHESFVAIAPYGTSLTWTRLRLAEGRRYPFRADPSDSFRATTMYADWHTNDYWDDVPQWIRDLESDRVVLAPWRSATVPAFAVDLVGAYASAQQAAQVQVPVLLVYGEQDVTEEPLADLQVFRSAPSVAMTIVPRMGHSYLLASTREVAWARLDAFIHEVLALRTLGYP